MRKTVCTVLISIITSLVLSGCAFCDEDITFSQRNIGDNFGGSRDGHFKKVADKYCLLVLLGYDASLFRVPDKYMNNDWGDIAWCCEDVLLSGHYIKGYYTSDYLILCEEKSDDSLTYVAFDFHDENIQYFSTLSEVYQLSGTDSFPWITLCNPNEQIRSH